MKLISFAFFMIASTLPVFALTDARSLNDFIVSEGGHDVYIDEKTVVGVTAYGTRFLLHEGEALQSGLPNIAAHCREDYPQSYTLQKLCVETEEKSRDQLMNRR